MADPMQTAVDVLARALADLDMWPLDDDHFNRAARLILAEIAPMIEAAEREACAKVADEHLGRVLPHCPDTEKADLVAQGYGNAARNIAAAIRERGKA